MAPHSSVLAWRIPGMGEPGGLPSMGSHRVRHNWSDLAAAATYSFPSLEPVSCSMSGSNCCLLVHKQVSQETGKMVWYSYLFKNFAWFIVIHTVKGFSIVNEAEVDVFLELFCFLHDPTNVGNLISGSSGSLKPSLYIWNISVHVLLKPNLKDFEHNFASMWNEHSCTVVWTFGGFPGASEG